MESDPLDDGRTLVSIAEEGWEATEAGQKASYQNCEGWTGALCAMKMWLEHRVNRRAVVGTLPLRPPGACPRRADHL